MTARDVALLVLSACGGAAHREAPVPATTPAPVVAVTADTALAAYKAKQWDACAAQYMTLAQIRGAGAMRPSAALYDAASCYAEAHQADRAFAALDQAVDLRDVAMVERDADLASLHADPRWGAMLAKVQAREQAWEKSIAQPAARRELLALALEDQAPRTVWIEANKRGEHPDWFPMQDVDMKTAAALRAIVARIGWPGKSLVGEDGESAAWLLIQHAVLDPALQRDALARMAPMIASGEVTEAHFAYLYDRVAEGEGRLQRYGTAFLGNDPAPIEDEAHVDARRAAIGLGPLAEYKQQIFSLYGKMDLPKPTAGRANAAYAAQQWAACAERFSAFAKIAAKPEQAGALHAAARCHALAGKPDLAFASLDAAIGAGLLALVEVRQDRDLASLHADARWPAMLATLERAVAAYERGLGDPALRRRLLAMPPDDARALAGILAKVGWPTPRMVGSDGTHAAAMLAEHAELTVQESVLTRITPPSDRIAGADYAAIFDRVALARHQPQRYGTQFEGVDPAPIEDRPNVDARRAEVGLPPLHEFRAELILARAPK